MVGSAGGQAPTQQSSNPPHPYLSMSIRGSNFFLFGRFRAVFQNFSGLALQVFADGFERGETDGLGLAGFEDGQVLRRDVHAVGQIVQPHFALRENHVEIDDDRHKLKPLIPVPRGFFVLHQTTSQEK